MHTIVGRDFINRWRRRFLTKRLDGLRSRHYSQPPSVLTAEMEARILEKTRQRPPDGSTHWSTRKLARLLKINHNHVANAWRRAGLQPHRFERYMLSDDPDFERKAADVIGLYVNPPQHAAVFAMDEKTAIQALDRLDPVLPLSPGRAERHGFEYYRHGTLSLFAALNTRTGEVVGQSIDAMVAESEHFHFGLPEHVQRNRTLLLGVMHGAGFTHIKSEWWHYELPGSRELALIYNEECGPLRLM